MDSESKILPRNRTARQHQRVTGNPVTALLESGVGNCFPGLEMDVRNLERRFFPYLAVDLVGGNAIVVEVDREGMRRSADLSAEQRTVCEQVARDTDDPNQPYWEITGRFAKSTRSSISSATWWWISTHWVGTSRPTPGPQLG